MSRFPHFPSFALAGLKIWRPPALKVSYLRRYDELGDVSMHSYIASELYRTPGVRPTGVSRVYWAYQRYFLITATGHRSYCNSLHVYCLWLSDHVTKLMSS